MAIKLVGDWKRYKAILNSTSFAKRLRNELNRGTARIASRYVSEIRREIRDKSYAKNANLTVNIKGSDTALVRDSDLVNGVTWRKINAGATFGPWFVGLLRSVDDAKTNLGIILHEGATIKVTAKMRAFFMVKAAENPGVWKPLKAGTTSIVIPPRRFITEVFARQDLKAMATDIWAESVRRAIFNR